MKNGKHNYSVDYIKLFLRREGRIVLGKNLSNVWLLTLVLTATFLAIAFSNGSLIFLEDKMKDPFINWVDIKNNNQDKDFDALEEELVLPENAETYHYKGVEYGYEFGYFFYENENIGWNYKYLICRFFGQLNSELVAAILSEDNVVNQWAITSVDEIPSNSLGIIITEKALNSLGYKVPPAYLDLASHSAGADLIGIKTHDGRARAPLPILGVVKRLPGNVDMISSSRFYQQNFNKVHTFNLNKEQYARSLCYFVPSDVNLIEFEDDLKEFLSKETSVSFAIDDEGFYPEDQFSYKNHQIVGGEDVYANYVRIVVTDTLCLDYPVIRSVNEGIMKKYASRDVHRLYPYFYDEGSSNVGAYLSVHFVDLNNIRAFQSFVNDFGVEIEMSQINAKENFNSVRLMAGVLSWAIIAFAIVCILLFIVNLLQSYFQKVKRNIGTFKAFGISNYELYKVYLLIIVFLVVASIVLSLSIVLTIQIMLPLFGIMKEGTYNYLSLAGPKTLYSIIFIIGSALYAVYRLMSNMLKSTPGNLIYDR